jgi:hypothetical protein
MIVTRTNSFSRRRINKMRMKVKENEQENEIKEFIHDLARNYGWYLIRRRNNYAIEIKIYEKDETTGDRQVSIIKTITISGNWAVMKDFRTALLNCKENKQEAFIELEKIWGISQKVLEDAIDNTVNVA